MFIGFWILFILIECSISKSLIRTSPIVDLVENSRLNTFVIQLNESLDIANTTSHKFVLLNINGFESKLFSIINGNIYTKDLIDREELIDNNYCSGRPYCKIELHILVDDGLAYMVIPIHIIE